MDYLISTHSYANIISLMNLVWLSKSCDNCYIYLDRYNGFDDGSRWLANSRSICCNKMIIIIFRSWLILRSFRTCFYLWITSILIFEDTCLFSLLFCLCRELCIAWFPNFTYFWIVFFNQLWIPNIKMCISRFYKTGHKFWIIFITKDPQIFPKETNWKKNVWKTKLKLFRGPKWKKKYFKTKLKNFIFRWPLYLKVNFKKLNHEFTLILISISLTKTFLSVISNTFTLFSPYLPIYL